MSNSQAVSVDGPVADNSTYTEQVGNCDSLPVSSKSERDLRVSPHYSSQNFDVKCLETMYVLG